jgi:hypothetical protein
MQLTTKAFAALAAVAFGAVLLSGLQAMAETAGATDQPVKEAAAPPPPMTAESRISAVIEFSLPALDRALERRVPKRLASFEDHATLCWHRRILRREVDIDCVYSGFVERTAPISLRADKGRLEATVPIYGRVAGQGLGRFARILHGAGEGQLTVYATARPRLKPDWNVDMGMAEGFRWQEPPVLRILGFNINLSRFVEPKVREQLERVRGEADAYMRGLDIRAKSEAAWRAAFTPVKISDTPEIWLQMTPHTVAFAGTRAHGDVLEGAIEMKATTQTSIGAAPAANPPTPLPALSADVSEPGSFEIVVPVVLSYDAIREKIQDASSALNSAGLELREAQVHPSGDKIVFGLRLAAAGAAAAAGDWVYLTATPHLNSENQTVDFPDIALSTTAKSPPSSLTDWFNDNSHMQMLRQRLTVAYREGLSKIVASANARLTRSLGNGFRSEAHLASAAKPDLRILPDAVRLDFRAKGDLKILYGL